MSATKKHISFDTRYKSVQNESIKGYDSVTVEIIVRIDSSIVDKMTDIEFLQMQNAVAGNALLIERDFLKTLNIILKRKE